MASRVGQLTKAIDALLTIDAHALTEDELHELVVTLQRQRHRLAAAAAGAISVWDQRLVWADNGSRSAVARLANDTSVSPAGAGTEIRRARRLRTMPHTAAALAAGDISTDHVDLLARADKTWRHATFSDHEESLVEQCRQLRYAHARKVIDYWCLRADAEAAEERAERQHEATYLHMSATIDGTFVINGTFDPINGTIVNDELGRIEHDLYLAGKRDGTVRTASQRRAAALVEMAKRSATAPANGRRPRPLFTVLVGDDTAATLCELADGTVIAPGQLFRWLGDADLETVLFDGPSTVISVSHRRSFTGALRRAVEVRDRHCKHTSGCDITAARCDVDHIIPYTDDGPTSQFNGRLECTTHNRDSNRHDHGATPRPSRPIDRLDEIRCRLRWQLLREQPAGVDERPPDDCPDG